MITFSGHTIDETLVPKNPIVLDVGARNFAFTNGILSLWPDATIVAMEPDPIVVDPKKPGVLYLNYALVHDGRKDSGYASYSTGEGNFLTESPAYYDAKMIRVPCLNLAAVMERTKITRWDVVKLDCEGSEFGILQNWPGPIATQISVEFHDYSDLDSYNDTYYAALFEKMKHYRPVQHGLTEIGPGAARGHWDSLFVLKT